MYINVLKWIIRNTKSLLIKNKTHDCDKKMN
jgi:hypothetical protein